MPLQENQKHPLIVLAEAHMEKLKETNLDPYTDHNMRNQFCIFEDPEKGVVIGRPGPWTGEPYDSQLYIRLPNGTTVRKERARLIFLVQRLLTPKEQRLIAKYITQSI